MLHLNETGNISRTDLSMKEELCSSLKDGNGCSEENGARYREG